MAGVHQVSLSGNATIELAVALLEELDALAAEQPGLRVLIDEDGLTPGALGIEALRAIGDVWRTMKHLEGTRIAIVAPSEVLYGMTRQAFAFADGAAERAVFRTRAEAEAWLSL